MDFIDELKQFSKQVRSVKDMIATEEATKTALVLPFFQMLGYNVFNPAEFVPEFTADVGLKKGEKVDYTILLNDKPAILIEAKWCGAPLENHHSQLFRYFGTTTAKFGILTNGLVYKFYTDLDEPNKMDLIPFLELNLLDINETVVPEVKRFAKERIDMDAVFAAASDLKYSNLIKALLQRQRTTPEEAFVNYILGEIYDGKRTKAVCEKFTPIIKKAFNAYLNEIINETLKSAMQKQEEQEGHPADEPLQLDAQPEQADAPRIVTTKEELEAFATVKAILREQVDVSRIFYKDTETYFGILLDNNVRKWICRIKISPSRVTVIFPADGRQTVKVDIPSLDELYGLEEQLKQSVDRYTLATHGSDEA